MRGITPSFLVTGPLNEENRAPAERFKSIGVDRNCLAPFFTYVTRREGAAMDWRHRSACRDEDPELFFPVGNTGPALQQIEEAKKVCNRCLVINECLKWALESGQEAGVWGGLSEDERRALKRRAARNRARGIENPNPYEINQQ